MTAIPEPVPTDPPADPPVRTMSRINRADADPLLLSTLERLADDYGPVVVALTAAGLLPNVALIRDEPIKVQVEFGGQRLEVGSFVPVPAPERVRSVRVASAPLPRTFQVTRSEQYGLPCVIAEPGDDPAAVIEACRHAGAVRTVDGEEFVVELPLLGREVGPELWTAEALHSSLPIATSALDAPDANA